MQTTLCSTVALESKFKSWLCTGDAEWPCLASVVLTSWSQAALQDACISTRVLAVAESVLSVIWCCKIEENKQYADSKTIFIILKKKKTFKVKSNSAFSSDLYWNLEDFSNSLNFVCVIFFLNSKLFLR